MRHASPETIASLEPLIARIRALPGLTEKKPGTFYRKSSAFLHFHEDPAGLFADVKLDGKNFERFEVGRSSLDAALVKAARVALEG
jgi:hypothetical protein